MPKYFYFNLEYCEYFDELNNEQAGKVIKMICDYVRDIETKTNDIDTDNIDKGVKIVVKAMKKDIDKAFKKYHAQCENGKKGGAPKGNKNAAKVKSNVSVRYKNLTYDKINEELSWIIENIYDEAKRTNFDIDKRLKQSQIAELAACYRLYDIYDFINFNYDYETIKEFVFNESISILLKTVKEDSKDYVTSNNLEYCKPNKFFSTFADYVERALNILELPIDDRKKFTDICYAIFEVDYSYSELKERFTPEEISFIENEIVKNKTTQKQPQNNPK